jgi:tRNA(Ile2) C34 agmatinyltransferase TiaS
MCTDQELEAGLKKQAEAIIERVLTHKKAAGENSLEELERLAVEAGRGFQERVLGMLVEEESKVETEPVCKRCGRRMQSRGKRKRYLVTEAGEIQLERRSYVCLGCGGRVFPPR